MMSIILLEKLRKVIVIGIMVEVGSGCKSFSVGVMKVCVCWEMLIRVFSKIFVNDVRSYLNSMC